MRYLGCTRGDLYRPVPEACLMSPSRLCIIPLQDLLALPSECRMNMPGTENGNWRWRMPPEHLHEEQLFPNAAELTEIYGRAADEDFGF